MFRSHKAWDKQYHPNPRPTPLSARGHIENRWVYVCFEHSVKKESGNKTKQKENRWVQGGKAGSKVAVATARVALVASVTPPERDLLRPVHGQGWSMPPETSSAG
uniref:Uncharacterized protein n=1 Tax=Eutreptiella gymnastica TaxID=73025 RepID=A0A7S1ISY2_9EUGL